MSLACAILVISVQGANIVIEERKRDVGFQIVLNYAEQNIEIKKYRSKYQWYIEL